MWKSVIQTYRAVAEANRRSPLRCGNVILVPPGAEVVISGDLHGHGANLLRIESLADLEANPNRHVILQELIHTACASDEPAAEDASHHVLSRVVRWQNRCPGRIHVVLGNHELAQMTDQEILKAGAGICRNFNLAVAKHYGDWTAEVLAAMNDYFRSLPLAAMTDAGVAVVHSLPADRAVADFDTTVFHRPLRHLDYQRPGSVYQLLWGRTFSRRSIDCIKSALGAKVFVIGHVPQPQGLLVVEDDLLIIASDHNGGVVLSLPAGPIPSAAALAERAVRLNSIEM